MKVTAVSRVRRPPKVLKVTENETADIKRLVILFSSWLSYDIAASVKPPALLLKSWLSIKAAKGMVLLEHPVLMRCIVRASIW